MLVGGSAVWNVGSIGVVWVLWCCVGVMGGGTVGAENSLRHTRSVCVVRAILREYCCREYWWRVFEDEEVRGYLCDVVEKGTSLSSEEARCRVWEELLDSFLSCGDE